MAWIDDNRVCHTVGHCTDPCKQAQRGCRCVGAVFPGGTRGDDLSGVGGRASRPIQSARRHRAARDVGELALATLSELNRSQSCRFGRGARKLWASCPKGCAAGADAARRHDRAGHRAHNRASGHRTSCDLRGVPVLRRGALRMRRVLSLSPAKRGEGAERMRGGRGAVAIF